MQVNPFRAKIHAWALLITYSSPAQPGQNTLDIYRHGKPGRIMPGTTQFDPKDGKPSYNILYCDGHVSTAITAEEGYRAVRQRFPG